MSHNSLVSPSDVKGPERRGRRGTGAGCAELAKSPSGKTAVRAGGGSPYPLRSGDLSVAETEEDSEFESRRICRRNNYVIITNLVRPYYLGGLGCHWDD